MTFYLVHREAKRWELFSANGTHIGSYRWRSRALTVARLLAGPGGQVLCIDMIMPAGRQALADAISGGLQ